MEISQIKTTINEKEYGFLRNNEHLGDNIILLTLGGSHAYGTNKECSDLDVRGIAVERKHELIGLSNFEQFENKETDTVIYGVRKIFNLLLNSNPNVLELLGTKDEHLLICTEEGKLIRDNINLFLSNRVVNSFGGYSTAQLRRLENALARDNYPQDKKEEHIINSVKNQMVSFHDRYKEFDDSIKLYVDKSDKADFDSEIFIDIDLKHYPLRDLNGMYSEMTNVVKDYDKLNHRNSKKDEPHLLKHAMHLIRILKMGSEILQGKGVNTYRTTDRELLLDIRNGKYSYDEIFELVNKYDKEFQYARDNSMLPDKPDYHKIEELLMTIYSMKLRRVI